MKYFFFVTLISFSASLHAQSLDSVIITPVRITSSIYMLKGEGGNIGVLTGADGTLIIDSQYAPLSNKINGAIKSISPAAIRFLIDTHVHDDHTDGNGNFKRMNATIVAHETVRTRLSTESMDAETKKVIPAKEKAMLPEITFRDKMTFHLNDEDIEIIHFLPAHTDGDVVVYFKHANVFHLGDLFVTYGYPFIDFNSGGSINGFITSLDQILLLMNETSRIIPGHGEVCSKDDVKQFRSNLADIRDKVAAALKSGKKIEDIASLGITNPYDAQWNKSFISGKDFVFMIATDLKKSMSKK